MQLNIPWAKFSLLVIKSLITSFGFLSSGFFAFNEDSYSLLKVLKLSFNFLIKKTSKNSIKSCKVLLLLVKTTLNSSLSVVVSDIVFSGFSATFIYLIHQYILYNIFCLISFDSLSLNMLFKSSFDKR